MNSVFEFLFCPQHGLCRPDNFLMAWSAGQALLLQVGYYLRKTGVL